MLGINIMVTREVGTIRGSNAGGKRISKQNNVGLYVLSDSVIYSFNTRVKRNAASI